MIRTLTMILGLMVASDAQAAATLDGPTQVDAGTPAVFTIKGVPAENLKDFNWQIFNRPVDAMVLDLSDRQGNPVLMFWSKTPTKCAVICDVNVPGAFELIVHEFTVESAQPEPQPDPQPNPQPNPNPTPTKAVYGVIIEERDDRDDLGVQRAMVMESSKVRALFEPKHFQIRDDDVVDEGGKEPPADVKPYIDQARKLGLPALFLVDEAGKVLFEGPVPADVPATVELIEGYVR